jgi:hypothetical protein
MACVLVGIRLVASFVCSTCFHEFEEPPDRVFYLHAGDQDACHHGRAQASPLVGWACGVTQDESAFVLPDIPRLPVLISQFVPWILLLVTYRGLPLIAAVGRGPPALVS